MHASLFATGIFYLNNYVFGRLQIYFKDFRQHYASLTSHSVAENVAYISREHSLNSFPGDLEALTITLTLTLN